MLTATVALFDVDDVEAFVQATLNRFCQANSRRGHIVLAPDERDELVLEGLAIMQRLANQFEPHREGYAQAGRFSGYAAQMLPRKLGDAWHALHPEHQLVTQPDGKRRWQYERPSVSLDAITSEDGDRAPLLADSAKLSPAALKTRMHAAMFERWTAKVKLWAEIGELLAHGATDADIQEILGLTGEQVREAKAAIALEMGSILGGEQ